MFTQDLRCCALRAGLCVLVWKECAREHAEGKSPRTHAWERLRPRTVRRWRWRSDGNSMVEELARLRLDLAGERERRAAVEQRAAVDLAVEQRARADEQRARADLAATIAALKQQHEQDRKTWREGAVAQHGACVRVRARARVWGYVCAQ